MNLKQKINIAEIVSALRNLHRKARLSVFEIGALAVALVFALTVTFLYLTRIQPLRNQVAELQTKQQNLRNQLSKVSVEQRRAAEQSANAEKILESLTKFEESLKSDESGMTQILNEIDVLCTSHKILSGVSTYNFTEPVQARDENGENVIRVNREKIDFYPVFGIDTTVTGDYRNLRRFIFDLERSKQFLVIKSVQFQGEGDKYGRNSGSQGNPQQQKIQLSSPEAIPVSLKIEMDTYFQKQSVKTR
jgi:Tfp pilus assembly protein PilO